MKVFRPRTFLNLVLLGFIAVSVPLGVGLWTTLTYIEEVTGKGLEVVDNSVSGTRDSEILSEYLRNEERTLRLYSITSEVQYLKQAQTYHNQIDGVLFELLSLPLEFAVKKDIESMRSSRNLLRTDIIEALSKPDNGTMAAINSAIESFGTQHDRALKIRDGILAMVQQEVDGLKKTTAEAQHVLVSQTITFILATIFMIAVMAFLLSWPVRQLNKSVERLGNGDFKTPVLVTGPLDVEAVGEKLDWLRKRLDALEQEKSKFLAHISHELKTPLASIREGAALLSEELVGDLNDKQLEVSSILVNNSILLQQLIENIIDFNMSQAGQKSLDVSPIDLKALLQKVAYAQTAKMISRDIRLDLKLDEATVYGDSKQIETIFENLFSNAIKFSPAGGIVGCRLTAGRKSVACIVFDSGPGIAEEEKNNVFQPFYQVETAAHSIVKGSGLGLAIVKEYVKNHHGKISLLNPGKSGARFGVTLPINRETRRDEV